MGMAKVAIQIGFDEEGRLQCDAPGVRPEQIVFLLEKVKHDLMQTVQIGAPEQKIQAVPAGVLSTLPTLNGRH